MERVSKLGETLVYYAMKLDASSLSWRANRAERYIQMLKNESKADLTDCNAPMVLWCYCVERQAKIISSVVRNNHLLQGMVPNSKMTGKPCDISHLAEYGWYEWCIYRKEDVTYPI